MCGAPWRSRQGVADMAPSDQGAEALGQIYDGLVAQEVRRARADRARFAPMDALLLGVACGYVLDAGCGTGRLLGALARRREVKGVVGVDLSLASLRVARAAGAPVLRGDVRALPFVAGAFDAAVAAYGVLAHVEPGAAARSFARVVRPGGRIAVHQFGRWPLRAVSRLRAWQRGVWKASDFHPYAIARWRAWWRPWAAAGWRLERVACWAWVPKLGRFGPFDTRAFAPAAWDVVVVAVRG